MILAESTVADGDHNAVEVVEAAAPSVALVVEENMIVVEVAANR